MLKGNGVKVTGDIYIHEKTAEDLTGPARIMYMGPKKSQTRRKYRHQRDEAGQEKNTQSPSPHSNDSNANTVIVADNEDSQQTN